jgi:hypothetical protein
MMLQLFMLDSVAMRQQMDAPSILQSLIACTRYFGPGVFMNRTPPTSHRDSGWFIGCRNDEHDHSDPANLTCISIYEAFLRQKGILEFASFPVGSVILMDHENGIQMWKDDEKLEVQPGSFLAECLKRQNR